MIHFGVIAPALHSHFSAMASLASALVARGHRVTFFHQTDARAFLNDDAAAFVALGLTSHPPGALQGTLRRAGRPESPWGLRRVIKDMAATTDMLCRELPDALHQHGVQALLCDQMEAAGGITAEAMGLPFVSIACALPVNRSPGVPLPVMPFAFDTSAFALKQYKTSTDIYDFLMRPLGRVIAHHAARHGLPPRTGLHECLSPLTQISQTIAPFDFPMAQPLPRFHAVGPFRAASVRAASQAPVACTPDDRPAAPFVFASLGTMQGHRFGVFKRIAAACRLIDAELLIAHCGGLNDAQCRTLLQCGATTVTDFVDQPATLARADLVVTHAGLNTVMDAIAAGTPMLALPLAFDQPGVAARIEHAGIGKKASAHFTSARRLSEHMRDLMTDTTIRRELNALGHVLANAGGAVRAAEIIETTVAQARGAHQTTGVASSDAPAAARPTEGAGVAAASAHRPDAAINAAQSDTPALDLILVGGGLANCLIAWRLRQMRPTCRMVILEQGTALGGNHTWSFHDGDLTPAQHAWIKPLVSHHWPQYTVAFPARERLLDSGYNTIFSDHFAARIAQDLGDIVQIGAAVRSVSPTAVVLESGRTLTAGAVIDGRGAAESEHVALGLQRFLGQEIQTDAPHGLDAPIIMDARVPQGQGYRFVYVLPFSDDTLLIEDTHYVDDATVGSAPLQDESLRKNIADYAHQHGWTIKSILREEQGALPITLAGDFPAFWREAAQQPRSGLRAGLFHPTTGYSLPHAVRLAFDIAALPDLRAPALYAAIRRHAHQEWRAQGFFRLLNRMLFLAGEPHERWRVMQRFYGLPAPLIGRFYAQGLTAADKLRIVSGQPPVPVGQAIQAALKTQPKNIRKKA